MLRHFTAQGQQAGAGDITAASLAMDCTMATGLENFPGHSVVQVPPDWLSYSPDWGMCIHWLSASSRCQWCVGPQWHSITRIHISVSVCSLMDPHTHNLYTLNNVKMTPQTSEYIGAFAVVFCFKSISMALAWIPWSIIIKIHYFYQWYFPKFHIVFTVISTSRLHFCCKQLFC